MITCGSHVGDDVVLHAAWHLCRDGDGREESLESEKVEKTGDRRSSGSCVAVFTRWLVAFPDEDDGGRDSRRDFEHMVEDEEDGSSRVSR
ncbi:hypothetical protein E3N88_26252 [Mikania micrantha]|uniref:Uncharacterized protein n=1 Tax=Mikania micrantha TaxID=192012 RepID=A0A5N6N8U3_9ASTR|nr:hypothetical protein E3N88_26252 [Mikania micrantha]